MKVRLDVSLVDYQILLNYKKDKNVFFYITIIYYRYEETKNPDMILFNHIWVFAITKERRTVQKSFFG